MSEKYEPTTSAEVTLDELAQRRASLSGPSGITGVLRQPRLIALAAVTTLGAVCYGYEQGAFSQVLVMPAFTSDSNFIKINTDSEFKGWVVSLLGVGGWVGSLLNGYACDALSRRWALFAGGIVVLIGTALTTAAQNPDWFFSGRFFIGAGVGALSASIPLYNSEIAPPQLRGTIVSIQQMAIVSGIMISFWLGYGTNYISNTNSVSWRLCLAIQGVPALLLCFLCVFYLPYTPRWLAGQGRFDEAVESLAWIRNRPIDDELIKIEMLEIRAEAAFEKEVNAERYPHLVNSTSAPWIVKARLQFLAFSRLFTTVHMFKRTATAGLMQFFQQMTGINCIIYYAPTIFEGLGLSGNTTSLLASGVVGIVFVISTIPAILVIDKIGRRPVLLIGSAVMGACLTLVAALVGSFEDDWSSHQGAAWAAVVFIWLYVGGFGASWGPVSWTVISEIFPLSTRAHGASFGASANWLTNFAVSIIVPIMLERITFGTYLVFLGFLILGVGWVWWLLPETKGKSLEEMDSVFGSGEGKADADRLLRIQLALLAENKLEILEDPSTRSQKVQQQQLEKRDLV
ncbi:hexose transport-related protein [Leucosporidium creatinivorum]|uniref:Hexose transport-related protein n=1 Tax=Leucosporidium creatinivorum TaxID=106004 RepID=A0A1Y2FBF4_9BASI|nr:hexose transport-related protein [Leucosporidium creatinivorum]